MRCFTLLTALAFGLSFMVASAAASKPLKAVASVGMIADIVRQVGGDTVEVSTLIGTGLDPHSYRQTRSDISLLASADIIFANGLHLEAQLVPLFESLQTRVPVVLVGEALDHSKLISANGFSGRFDPHAWMDPYIWREAVTIVRDALTNLSPQMEQEFTQRARQVQCDIDQMAASMSEMLATVPKSERVLVTAHDAFAYFGRAFDVEVVGIQGLSTEGEAGLYRIETLVNMLVERNIRAVFVESSVSEQNVKALIEGSAARGHEVLIGGTLFSDAMGTEGTFEGTYIGMLDHNATTITRALGGKAPQRGVTGRLAPSS